MARTPKVVKDRREQIIEAALRVFAQKGFARATNKDIAREAGITPGLIYHYFASKQALLKASIELYSPVQVTRSVPPEMLDLPVDALLRSLLKQILDLVEDDKFMRVMRVFLSELIHNPQVSPLGIPAIQEGTQFLADYLAMKMERGELRRADPNLATQVIMGSVMDIVLRRQILRDPVVLQYSHEQIAEEITTLALQGLIPR
ncbi:MAG: TetR/AcrR family transcriptional regulator [Anaerolineae bacterium]